MAQRRRKNIKVASASARLSSSYRGKKSKRRTKRKSQTKKVKPTDIKKLISLLRMAKRRRR